MSHLQIDRNVTGRVQFWAKKRVSNVGHQVSQIWGIWRSWKVVNILGGMSNQVEFEVSLILCAVGQGAFTWFTLQRHPEWVGCSLSSRSKLIFQKSFWTKRLQHLLEGFVRLFLEPIWSRVEQKCCTFGQHDPWHSLVAVDRGLFANL